MTQAASIVARARGCLGARFRLQGRDPATGLDCVGLAAIAFDRAPPPAGYGLRGGAADRFTALIAASGAMPIDPAEARAGDLLMVRPGPAQFHLLVLTGAGFIHADARLRRIVEVPGAVPWPAIAAWRG